MPDSFTIYGTVPSKKNTWKPKKGGGVYLPTAVKEEIYSLMLQVPSYLRGKKLRHPAIMFQFRVLPKMVRQDRDNMETAMLDILVQTGVLAEDNISHCNGWRISAPVEVSDRFDPPELEITIWPNEESAELAQRLSQITSEPLQPRSAA